MLHRKVLTFIGFLVFFLALSATSVKASFLPTSIADLTRKADAIMTGTVEDMQSAWNGDHTTIVTYVTVNVEEVIKNITPKKKPKKITLRIEGGIAEGLELVTSSMPKFTLNERVFLFLNVDTGIDPPASENDKLGDFIVTLWELGKFTISDDLVAIKDGKNKIRGRIAVGNFIKDIKKILTGYPEDPSYMDPKNLQ